MIFTPLLWHQNYIRYAFGNFFQIIILLQIITLFFSCLLSIYFKKKIIHSKNFRKTKKTNREFLCLSANASFDKEELLKVGE